MGVGFYNIRFRSGMDIPILPIRIDKLYFMNGEMVGTYWFEEIQLFMANGGEVLEINYAIIFDQYDYVLSDFIKTLEEFKKSDGLSRVVGKLLINSFYGRLGMGRESSRSLISDSDEHSEYTPFINNLVIYKKEIIRETIRNVAVASAITSKARIKLYNGYLDVLRAGGRLLYSDTDSIVAAFKKNDNPIDKCLGGVLFDSKKTDTKIKRAVFASSKTYSVIFEGGEEITKIKGVRACGVGFNEIYENFYNNKNIVLNDQWVFSKQNYTIDIKTISKTINLRDYNKRIFTNDKQNTHARIY